MNRVPQLSWLYWPVTWFTAAVKGFTLHPMKIQTLSGCTHTHKHKTHTVPMLKQNLRGLSLGCPPPRESVDLAKSPVMDDWTEQTSVYWSSELCAALPNNCDWVFCRHDADRQPQSRSHYQVHQLQVRLCYNKKQRNGHTIIAGTGGVQNQTRTTWMTHKLAEKNLLEEEAFYVIFFVSCFHMFTIIFMGVGMTSVLSSQRGILLPDVPVESFPPLDTSRRADKLWFASKLIVKVSLRSLLHYNHAAMQLCVLLGA